MLLRADRGLRHPSSKTARDAPRGVLTAARRLCSACPARSPASRRYRCSACADDHDRELVRLSRSSSTRQRRPRVPRTRRCHHHGIEGRTVVRIGIDPTGAIGTSCIVRTSLNDAPIDHCLTDLALTWKVRFSRERRLRRSSDYPFVLARRRTRRSPEASGLARGRRAIRPSRRPTWRGGGERCEMPPSQAARTFRARTFEVECRARRSAGGARSCAAKIDVRTSRPRLERSPCWGTPASPQHPT